MHPMDLLLRRRLVRVRAHVEAAHSRADALGGDGDSRGPRIHAYPEGKSRGPLVRDCDGIAMCLPWDCRCYGVAMW